MATVDRFSYETTQYRYSDLYKILLNLDARANDPVRVDLSSWNGEPFSRYVPYNMSVLTGFLITCILQEAELNAEIKREEARLLSVGVDVRVISPKLDARHNYAVIAKWLREQSIEELRSEAVFLKLELAAAKPRARFETRFSWDPPLDYSSGDIIAPIDGWCQTKAKEWAKKHDWESLERLYRFEKRFKEQVRAGDSSILGRWLPDPSPPLGYLASEDAQTRKWLRKKLEPFDLEEALLAKLGRFGRHERRAEGTGDSPGFIMGMIVLDPPAMPVPKWKEESERDPLFRKRADLAFLKKLNVFVAQTLLEPDKSTGLFEWGRKLWALFDHEESNAVAWAADHLDLYWSDFVPGLSAWVRNILLIEFDLREARDAGRQLVPTWSKKYCFDPLTGTQIVVQATEEAFTLSSGPGTGSWSRTRPW